MTEIPAEFIGQRLDAAIAALRPELNLRGRRRLIDSAGVLVNGSPARPGYRLKRGDRLAFPRPDAAEPTPAPRFLGKFNNFWIFAKPAGTHTLSLAGRAGASLESWLKRWEKENRPGSSPLTLLQRLDCQTSGLILAADNEDAARAYRRAENAGLCRKYYLAVLSGRLATPATAKMILKTDNRKKTGVGPGDAPELCRTRFEPIASYSAASDEIATLTVASLRKGRRHQIRAHAAALGHPLLDDGKYGGSGDEAFFLTHFLMRTPFGNFFHYPDEWPKEAPEDKFKEYAAKIAPPGACVLI